MPGKFIKTSIPGVFLIEPLVFPDNRGFFMETYNRGIYSKEGIDLTFVQDNCSHSRKGTLRGLHYQLKNAQAKLVFVITGEIFDVAVDIRKKSPTFGAWIGEYLSSENRRQLFIPEGFAHGFCVVSEEADVIYKCTDFYTPGDDYGIYWADPEIKIAWPLDDIVLSGKDERNPCLSDVAGDLLPEYKRE
ncbi:MAG: dTDP-4-dehydrorhamnose 3,5-epimerase [Deltaproteobacteria bacterium]|nr:dTDP-4-dehydrorhamnose 3,5-epimerase [Deltaproteobacteria bacterium]